MTTITLKVDDRMQVALAEAIDLKTKALESVLTACIKQKQDEPAKLILKDIKALQELKEEVQSAE